MFTSFQLKQMNTCLSIMPALFKYIQVLKVTPWYYYVSGLILLPACFQVQHNTPEAWAFGEEQIIVHTCTVASFQNVNLT